jgi:hypothetical protein
MALMRSDVMVAARGVAFPMIRAFSRAKPRGIPESLP